MEGPKEPLPDSTNTLLFAMSYVGNTNYMEDALLKENVRKEKTT